MIHQQELRFRSFYVESSEDSQRNGTKGLRPKSIPQIVQVNHRFREKATGVLTTWRFFPKSSILGRLNGPGTISGAEGPS